MTLLTEAKVTLDNLREMLEMLNDDELLKDNDYEKYYEELCELEDKLEQITVDNLS